MSMNLDRLVWIDLETTALDPGEGFIIEAGIVITTRELDPVYRLDVLIPPPRHLEGSAQAILMHAKSGLLEEADSRGTWEISDVGNAFVRVINEKGAAGSPLCGASVHFDRAWMRVFMPHVLGLLHYRNFDVSTFKILAEMQGLKLPEKREAHRVIPDLEDAIALARWARDRFGVGAPKESPPWVGPGSVDE